jgi:hypothetical protein
MDLTKVKLETMKNYADKLASSFKVVYKKTVHGKNKTELIKFIQEVESKYGKIDFDIEPKQSKEPKVTLLEEARKLPGFKKSYEKKSKEFLEEFIQKNNNPIGDESNISPINFKELVEFVPSPQLCLQDAVLACFSTH